MPIARETTATKPRGVLTHLLAFGGACAVLYLVFLGLQTNPTTAGFLRQLGLLPAPRPQFTPEGLVMFNGAARALRPVTVYKSPSLGGIPGGSYHEQPIGQMAQGSVSCITFYSTDHAPILQLSSLSAGAIVRTYAKNEAGNFSPDPDNAACSGIRPSPNPQQ